MSDVEHPYQAWLGISATNSQPNYYELLGLKLYEPDPQRIAAAADRALSRVRSQRPGSRGTEWAALLDELKQVKVCLLDADQKTAYDESLRSSAVATSPKPPPLPPPLAPDRARVPSEPGPMRESRNAVPPKHVKNAKPIEAPIAPSAIAPSAIAPSAIAPSAIAPSAGVDTDTDDDVAQYFLPLPTPTPATTAPGGGDPMAPFFVPINEPVSPPAMAAHPSVEQATTGPVVIARKMERKNPLPIVAGVAGACLVVILAAAYYFIKRDDWQRESELAQAKSSTSNSAQPIQETRLPPPPTDTDKNATTTPETAPSETPAAAPTLDVTPTNVAPSTTTGTSETPVEIPVPEISNVVPTTPAPATTPAPTTTPATTTPATTTPEPPPPMPTPEELKALSGALKSAREALSEQRFDDADKQLAKAEGIAQLPEHKAMVMRLQKLGQYARNFRAAIDQAVEKVPGGNSFELSNGEPVVMVERMTDAIKIRWKGQNLDFSLNKLPLAIALPLSSVALDQSPASKVAKGAYQALHKRATPEHIEEVRRWWTEAKDEGEDVEDLLPVLEDKYDF